MYFHLILVFCVIQNAAQIPYKIDREIQFSNSNRNDIDLYHKETPNKSHFKEDPSDMSGESRRIFDWIKNLLNKNDTVKTNQKPTYEEILEERIRFRHIEKNLTVTLTKLSNVLNQILNIVKYARYNHFDDIHAFLPTKLRSNKVNRHHNRFNRGLYKRNIIPTEIDHENNNYRGENISGNAKDHKEDTKMILNESGHKVHENIENSNVKTEIDTRNNVSSTNSEESIFKTATKHTNDDVSTKSDTKAYVPAKLGSLNLNIQETRVKRENTEVKKEVAKNLEVLKKVEVQNKNSSVKYEAKDKDNTTEADINITKINGRRAMIPTKVTNDEVKNRLFQYIDEAFSEIFKRIVSLKQTKQMFAKDVSYQVGYIISNIDTLEVNVRNMKRDMDKNRFIWDDKKILNLYDTVKVSNQAVADLLEILKIYIQKSLSEQAGSV